MFSCKFWKNVQNTFSKKHPQVLLLLTSNKVLQVMVNTGIVTELGFTFVSTCLS